MDEEITQQKVNSMFVDVKSEWDSMVKKSGQSEQMFIALGGEDVTYFLVRNQEVKDYIESIGLVYPDLVKGLTVKIS